MFVLFYREYFDICLNRYRYITKIFINFHVILVDTIMFDKIESDKAKLIALYLKSESNPATIHELKQELHIKYLELYSVLELLINTGIVEKIGSETYKIKE